MAVNIIQQVVCEGGKASYMVTRFIVADADLISLDRHLQVAAEVARPAVTFPVAGHHCPLAGTRSY